MAAALNDRGLTSARREYARPDSPGISRVSRLASAAAALEFGRPEPRPVEHQRAVLLARLDGGMFEPLVPRGDDHPVGGALENGRPHEIVETCPIARHDGVPGAR